MPNVGDARTADWANDRPRVDVGSVTLTPPAGGGVVSTTITFDKPFDNPPIIQVAVGTSAPQNSAVGFTAVSVTQFTINFYRTTVVNTTVHWTATAQ